MELTLPGILRIALAVITGLVTVFLIKLYRVRSYIRQLQKQGLVGLRISYLVDDVNFKFAQSPCLRTTGC